MVLIDGTPFKDRRMIVVLGIGCHGRKTVEGATENAAVVGALLSELLERGLDFSTSLLYVLDSGKVLHTAVCWHAAESAFIQRCQVHKKRNAVDHLPEEHKADVRRKLQSAYWMIDYGHAKSELRLPDQLRRTSSCTNVIDSALSVVKIVCRNVKAGERIIKSNVGLVPACSLPSSGFIR